MDGRKPFTFTAPKASSEAMLVTAYYTPMSDEEMSVNKDMLQQLKFSLLSRSSSSLPALPQARCADSCMLKLARDHYKKEHVVEKKTTREFCSKCCCEDCVRVQEERKRKADEKASKSKKARTTQS